MKISRIVNKISFLTHPSFKCAFMSVTESGWLEIKVERCPVYRYTGEGTFVKRQSKDELYLLPSISVEQEKLVMYKGAFLFQAYSPLPINRRQLKREGDNSESLGM